MRRNLYPLLLSVALQVISFIPCSTSMAQVAPSQDIAAQFSEFDIINPLLVRSNITATLDMGRLNNIQFYDAAGMKSFYEARNFEPIWVGSSLFSGDKIHTIVSTLKNSWKHGLNPASYHVSEIEELVLQKDDESRMQLDLLLSDSLIRYGRDISAMRVDPQKIGQRARYWRQPLQTFDVLSHVSTQTNIGDALRSMEPRGQLYKKLQEELVKLYKIKEVPDQMPKVIVDRPIQPGKSYKQILAVRKRMGFIADASNDKSYIYDDSLAAAVMAFQKAHGLSPDGIIGPQTAKIMNITREDKINQVLANLERLRWVEQNKPDRYIMVNVASAVLWAIEKGQVKLEMPVIVGRVDRPTNIFSTVVTGIRYNPTWTVPPTIKREDYLPKLRKDSYYLADRGIELVESGKTIDPGLVDWNNKSWEEVNAMSMVQGSGANNPLGQVRFIMDNPFNIYLHDTNSKSYFSKSDRTLSSGCIRLQKPIELADFVLNANADWSEEKREAILARGKMTEVVAENPIPVYILYQTVWLGEHGQVIYGADVYGHDATLMRALKEINGVPSPVTMGDSSTKSAQLVIR